MSMSLTVDALAGLVPAFRVLKETDSTNRVAAAWAEEGAEEWSVVSAEHQTAGRGRLDRTWFAPKGGALLFSVIVAAPIQAPHLINLSAAVAVHSVLVARGFAPDVKWPNDLLIGTRKVAGILSEMVQGSRDMVIVGVGLNVNVNQFPEDLAATATSLSLEAGGPIERGPLLADILRAFKYWASVPTSQMLDAYRTVCVTLGKVVHVEMVGGSHEGESVDVDDYGRLVLDDGTLVHVGDVIHLR